MGKDKTVKEKLDIIRDIFESDVSTVIMLYRRVGGDMFHQFQLTGYQIDMLVFIMKLSGYTIGKVVTGPQIAKKATKRFRNVMRPIANTLVDRGFVEYLYNDTESRYKFKVGMTELGYSFALAWRDSINRHLESDGAELVLNARFSWEKAARKKSLGLGE